MSDTTRSARVVSVAGVETAQVARHESSADGVSWAPSMDVTLRQIA